MFRNSIIGRRLLLYIITFSFFITLITSAVIIYSDFRAGIRNLNASVERIEAGYLSSIAFSLWNFDRGQLSLQLKGIQNFPGIMACRVMDHNGNLVQSLGQVEDKKVVEEYFFPLQYREAGKTTQLGKLVIVVTKEELYRGLWDKIIVILVSQFFKTLAVSLFILFIVYQLITRHINKMSSWASIIKADLPDNPLILDRSPILNDELSDVSNAINHMYSSVSQYQNQLNQANQSLAENNAQLENRVKERTVDLNMMIDRLQETVSELQETQSRLVEAEKHAALGQLVAGVAHEINTPLGLCVTTQSYIQDNISNMLEQVKTGQITKTEFLDYYRLVDESLELLKDNLGRTAQLVQSFKQVAVQSEGQQMAQISLNKHIEMVILHMQPLLQTGNFEVQVHNQQPVTLTTYPNAVENVLQALIENSILHGFSQAEGRIDIEINKSGDCVELYYQDNGVGMTEEVSQKIFEPFFTTQREAGQVGLGMHVTYNVVTQLLGGNIVCCPNANGAFFQISLKDFASDKKTTLNKCSE